MWWSGWSCWEWWFAFHVCFTSSLTFTIKSCIEKHHIWEVMSTRITTSSSWLYLPWLKVTLCHGSQECLQESVWLFCGLSSVWTWSTFTIATWELIWWLSITKRAWKRLRMSWTVAEHLSCGIVFTEDGRGMRKILLHFILYRAGEGVMWDIPPWTIQDPPEHKIRIPPRNFR